jgi:hypothetical protein
MAPQDELQICLLRSRVESCHVGSYAYGRMLKVDSLTGHDLVKFEC